MFPNKPIFSVLILRPLFDFVPQDVDVRKVFINDMLMFDCDKAPPGDKYVGVFSSKAKTKTMTNSHLDPGHAILLYTIIDYHFNSYVNLNTHVLNNAVYYILPIFSKNLNL